VDLHLRLASGVSPGLISGKGSTSCLIRLLSHGKKCDHLVTYLLQSMQFGVSSLISNLMEVNETLCMLTEPTVGHCFGRRYFRVRSYLKTSIPPTFNPAACPESQMSKASAVGRADYVKWYVPPPHRSAQSLNYQFQPSCALSSGTHRHGYHVIRLSGENQAHCG
jgi:hypothetical protein